MERQRISSFESFSIGPVSGILAINGGSIAEAFFGQIVNDPGGAAPETVSGTPTNPLTLQSPASNTGVAISAPSTQVVAGLAGGTEPEDVGEGLVSILFDADQSTFGLKILGAHTPSGDATFSFYARDGSPVDSVVMSSLVDGDYTFVSSGMLFAGVNISNTDPGGLAYDDLRFGVAVPAPAALVLLGLGLGLVSLVGARRCTWGLGRGDGKTGILRERALRQQGLYPAFYEAAGRVNSV